MPALDEAQLSAARERTFELLPVARNREGRSEEHTSELQSQSNLVCRLLLEKKKILPRAPISCTHAASSVSPAASRTGRTVYSCDSLSVRVSCARAIPCVEFSCVTVSGALDS